MWAELLYEFGDVVNLKKAGEKKEKPEKEKRIQFRRERQEMRKNKKSNKLLGMKLSKKKLKKMNATLTEMWNSQASDWVKADGRKWEFERFQRHVGTYFQNYIMMNDLLEPGGRASETSGSVCWSRGSRGSRSSCFFFT